ncbi:hypothetical protein CDL12_09280 [Handroanthus impetiginosus]|uniref:Uncharacterized protein n=1 Tax=Handroanthus impetiginosus TaxID=429701 RepID=A0A2G9HKL8_9LAMI|nr:hypothetical protein CDL12_09280 [Handroanthus impetiginosus]
MLFSLSQEKQNSIIFSRNVNINESTISLTFLISHMVSLKSEIKISTLISLQNIVANNEID